MNCWFWNIDIERQDYFRDELNQGRLRQGWGYSNDLDLRRIKTKIDQKEGLNKYSPVVPAPFRVALDKAHSPVIPTYKHRDTVIRLYTITAEEQRSKAETRAEKIETWRQCLIAELRRICPLQNDHQLAELLVLNILRHDGLEAVWTAGPMERGADVVATLYSRYTFAGDFRRFNRRTAEKPHRGDAEEVHV